MIDYNLYCLDKQNAKQAYYDDLEYYLEGVREENDYEVLDEEDKMIYDEDFESYLIANFNTDYDICISTDYVEFKKSLLNIA